MKIEKSPSCKVLKWDPDACCLRHLGQLCWQASLTNRHRGFKQLTPGKFSNLDSLKKKILLNLKWSIFQRDLRKSTDLFKNWIYLRLHSYTPDFHGDQTHSKAAPCLLKHCWKKHFNLSWGIHMLNESRNHILFRKASLKSLKMEMFVINKWKLLISFSDFLHTPLFLVNILTCCLVEFWEKDIWKNMTYYSVVC